MNITKSRWEEAQEFELGDWENEEGIVEKEWEEALLKYSKYFKKLEKKLKITAQWKILDVGCNITCISRMISKGAHVGVEPLANALDMDKLVPGVKIHQGLGENMPFLKNDTFNIAICRNVIDHTHSPEKVIKETIRVLKPKGYYLLACYVYNPFISFIKNFGERIIILRNVGHPHTYTMQTLEELVSKDFKIIDKKIIYEGISPNDFGKVEEIKDNLPTIQRVIMFINDKVLRKKWFVREYALLCKLPK